MLIQLFFLGFATSWGDPLLSSKKAKKNLSELVSSTPAPTTSYEFRRPGQDNDDWRDAREMLDVGARHPRHTASSDRQDHHQRARSGTIPATLRQIKSDGDGAATTARSTPDSSGNSRNSVKIQPARSKSAKREGVSNEDIAQRVTELEKQLQAGENDWVTLQYFALQVNCFQERAERVPLDATTTGKLAQLAQDPRMAIATLAFQLGQRGIEPKEAIEKLEVLLRPEDISLATLQTALRPIRNLEERKSQLRRHDKEKLDFLKQRTEQRFKSLLKQECLAAKRKQPKPLSFLPEACLACLSKKYDDADAHKGFEAFKNQKWNIKKLTFLTPEAKVTYQTFLTYLEDHRIFQEEHRIVQENNRIREAWKQAKKEHAFPADKERVLKEEQKNSAGCLNIIAQTQGEIDKELDKIRKKITQLEKRKEVLEQSRRALKNPDRPAEIAQEIRELLTAIEKLEIRKETLAPIADRHSVQLKTCKQLLSLPLLIDACFLSFLGQYNEAYEAFRTFQDGFHNLSAANFPYHVECKRQLLLNPDFVEFYEEKIREEWEQAKEEHKDDMPEEKLPEPETGIMARIWGSNLWIEKRREMQSETRKKLEALINAKYSCLLGQYKEAVDIYRCAKNVDLSDKKIKNREYYRIILEWLENHSHLQKLCTEQSQPNKWVERLLKTLEFFNEHAVQATFISLGVYTTFFASPDLGLSGLGAPEITNITDAFNSSAFSSFYSGSLATSSPGMIVGNNIASLIPGYGGLISAFLANSNCTDEPAQMLTQAFINLMKRAGKTMNLLCSSVKRPGSIDAYTTFCDNTAVEESFSGGKCGLTPLPKPPIRRSNVVIRLVGERSFFTGGRDLVQLQAYQFDPTGTRELTRSNERSGTHSEELSLDESASFSRSRRSGTEDNSASRSNSLLPPPSLSRSLSPSYTASTSTTMSLSSELPFPPLQIYFFGSGLGLYYARTNGSSVDVTSAHTLIKGNSSFMSTPTGLFVDPERNKVYFTDYSYSHTSPGGVYVGDFDPNAGKILMHNIRVQYPGGQFSGIFFDGQDMHYSGWCIPVSMTYFDPSKASALNLTNGTRILGYTNVNFNCAGYGSSFWWADTISADPENKKIYWGKGQLMTADMNGTTAQNIRPITSYSVRGFSIHYPTSTVYFTNDTTTIYRAFLNRTNPTLLKDAVVVAKDKTGLGFSGGIFVVPAAERILAPSSSPERTSSRSLSLSRSLCIPGNCTLLAEYLAANATAAGLIGTNFPCFGVVANNSIDSGVFQPQNTTLDLRNQNIGFAGAMAIAPALQQIPQLQTLILYGNNMGINGVTTIAIALECLRHLKYIHMDSNNMDDLGAIALASVFKNMPLLQYVILRNNGIENDGAMALCTSLQYHVALSQLAISGNSFNATTAAICKQLLPGITDL